VAVKHGWLVPAPSDWLFAFLPAGTLFVMLAAWNPAAVQVDTTCSLRTPPWAVKFGTVHIAVGTGVGVGVGVGVADADADADPEAEPLALPLALAEADGVGVGDGDGVGVGVTTGPVPLGGTM
jgi:hypothetical protein